MKTITKVLFALIIIILPASAMAQDNEKKTATVKFETSIDCQNCVNTIMKNIPFEKGVKDVTCNLETKVVTVVYQPQKNSPELLKRAIEKLGFTAKEIREKKKE